jgi:hypothetical protein
VSDRVRQQRSTDTSTRVLSVDVHAQYPRHVPSLFTAALALHRDRADVLSALIHRDERHRVGGGLGGERNGQNIGFRDAERVRMLPYTAPEKRVVRRSIRSRERS